MALPLLAIRAALGAGKFLARRYGGMGLKKAEGVAKEGIGARMKRGGLNALTDVAIGFTAADLYQYSKGKSERQVMDRLRKENPKLYKRYMASGATDVKDWLKEQRS